MSEPRILIAESLIAIMLSGAAIGTGVWWRKYRLRRLRLRGIKTYEQQAMRKAMKRSG